MSPAGPSPSSSSRDLTLVVESASGTPEEYFAQVGLSIGRATSNTIHIDHPEVDHIHAKMVRDGEDFSLRRVMGQKALCHQDRLQRPRQKSVADAWAECPTHRPGAKVEKLDAPLIF